MKILNSDLIFAIVVFACVVTFQPFMMILSLLFWSLWEDSRWPAFDSKDYDKKMMNGPLSPWDKGN